MPATAPLLTLHRWTVKPNEDGDFDVFDHDGDLVDQVATLEEATEVCTDAYRDRLWESIQEADVDGLPLYVLQAVADMIGLNAQTI